MILSEEKLKRSDEQYVAPYIDIVAVADNILSVSGLDKSFDDYDTDGWF